MKRLRGAYANRYGQTLSTTPQHELTRSLRAIGSSHKHVSTHLIGIDWFPSIPILENWSKHTCKYMEKSSLRTLLTQALQPKNAYATLPNSGFCLRTVSLWTSPYYKYEHLGFERCSKEHDAGCWLADAVKVVEKNDIETNVNRKLNARPCGHAQLQAKHTPWGLEG